jgi:hypothetical protein
MDDVKISETEVYLRRFYFGILGEKVFVRPNDFV